MNETVPKYAKDIPVEFRLATAVNDVAEEVSRAMKMHGPQRSAHESYSVILEELDEFWDEVKKKSSVRSDEKLREELVQTAAMAIRAIVDLNL